MIMQLNDFLEKIKKQSKEIEFSDVIALIEKSTSLARLNSKMVRI